MSEVGNVYGGRIIPALRYRNARRGDRLALRGLRL